jgi:hypothetical protein
MLGLRFRPTDAQRKGHTIAGTIWVDSASHLMRRLNLQYLEDGHLKSEVSVEYADVDVDGSKLRLPSRGTAAVLAPSNAPKGSRVDGTLTYSYSRFARVGAR